MTSETKKRIAAINSGIIPEGYKKTKVGIVPVEWETVRLKTISKHCTEKNKNLKYRETYTNSATQGIIKQTDYFDKQISNNENIDGYYVVRQNDYVYNPRISVSAPCGPISKSHFSETGVMSPLYTVFRLNDEYEDNGYIEHYFKSSFWYRYMSSVANYGARHDRMNITNEDLFNMPIPFPPLPEQQKIAEILSTQDKLIELQEKKIEQLKKLKKAYLQKMFPQKGSKYPELRFKGFTDPWEQRKFGDLGSVAMCKRIFKEQTTATGEIPFYKIGTFGGEPDAFISRELFEEYKAKFSYPEVGDMLISASGTIGRTVEYTGKDEYFQDSNIVWFKHDDRIDNSFLRCLYSIVKWSGIEGSTIKRLYNDNFLKTEFMLPCVAEQRKVGSFFSHLDTSITLHQRKSEQEKQKKKALMQLLLTGKVRCV